MADLRVGPGEGDESVLQRRLGRADRVFRQAERLGGGRFIDQGAGRLPEDDRLVNPEVGAKRRSPRSEGARRAHPRHPFQFVGRFQRQHPAEVEVADS